MSNSGFSKLFPLRLSCDMERVCPQAEPREQLSALQYAASSLAGAPLGVPQQALRMCHPLSHLLLLKKLSSLKAVLVLTSKTLYRTLHFIVL